MSHKIDNTTRKLKILKALHNKPMTMQELGEQVGFLRLHELVAELRIGNIIITNSATRKMELYNVEIVVK